MLNRTTTVVLSIFACTILFLALITPVSLALTVMGGTGGGGESSQERVESDPSGIRAKIVDIAQKEVGTGEQPPGSNNVPKYGATGFFWCSVFVTWVWQQAGVKIPELPYSGDVGEWAQKNTKFKRNNPQPGDAILYGRGFNDMEHIGIVTSVRGNKITTIEGNVSNAVTKRAPFEWKTDQNPAPVFGFASPIK